LYNFVWHELCDWYLEAIKPTLYGRQGPDQQEATMGVLWFTLRDTLVLLHPFMPFVTEEIWHKLPGTKGSVMRAEFPDTTVYADLDPDSRESVAQMEKLTAIISAIRNIRGEMNMPPSLELQVALHAQPSATRQMLTAHQDLIVNLARLKALEISEPGAKPQSAATAVIDDTTIFVFLEGTIDFAQEIERLEKEIAKIDGELQTFAKKLANASFLNKAPAEVVDKVRSRNETLTAKSDKLRATLTKIRSFSV
jgi:valyl-tRNA synthetase